MYIIYTLTNLIIIIRLVFSTEKFYKNFGLEFKVKIIKMRHIKTKKTTKKERESSMENEVKILKKSVRRRKEPLTKERSSTKSLVIKFTELNDILPDISSSIDKNSMKYLSNLYSESSDLIKNITLYMANKKYRGMHEFLDITVIKVQELIGILKEFESLNTSRKAHGFINKADEAKASLLLESLKGKMDELVIIKASTVK